ncbi:hypothetical protein [Colwellia echini]|uniref:Uncharacterized protein n=1 Tax=Colwellia echini TaxID=1982103 RepID=A0ABY3MTI5_9GAMM|nr:hypothetical protein [Colwellia echini]TYK64521.1 hypothetical protein CWS31_015240 [Colwellia echini]
MNLYKLGLFGMFFSLVLCLTAVYFVFINDSPIAFPWLMFWHFTLLITGLSFKLCYVMILASSQHKADPA